MLALTTEGNSMLEPIETVGDLAVATKLRDGYEAAVIRRMKESGFLEVEIRVECLQRAGESYQDPIIAAGWHYWQASRDDVVVELPDKWGEYTEPGFAACEAIDAFRAAIEAHGLKVAPAGERAL